MGLIDQFWMRRKTQYLTALHERYDKPGSNSQTIRVGDAVKIPNHSPRMCWKLAVNGTMIHGNDSLIHADRSKMANELITTRPIVKLYPLEVMDIINKCDHLEILCFKEPSNWSGSFEHQQHKSRLSSNLQSHNCIWRYESILCSVSGGAMLLLLTKTSRVQWISLVTVYPSLIYSTNHEKYTSIDANLIDPYLDI